MTTKVEKSGLLPVVQSMISENPEISDQKIANVLMRDYASKLEDGKITWFAIRNVRKKLDANRIIDMVDDDTELSSVALKEFRTIMLEGAKKAEEIYELAKDASELSIALKGLEQIRRNWVSMMDYYKKHVITPIQNITINEDKKVIVYMQKYTELLCANCRERVNRELLLDTKDE